MDRIEMKVIQENLRKSIDGKQIGFDAGLIGLWLTEIAIQLHRQNELLEKKNDLQTL